MFVVNGKNHILLPQHSGQSFTRSLWTHTGLELTCTKVQQCFNFLFYETGREEKRDCEENNYFLPNFPFLPECLSVHAGVSNVSVMSAQCPSWVKGGINRLSVSQALELCHDRQRRDGLGNFGSGI